MRRGGLKRSTHRHLYAFGCSSTQRGQDRMSPMAQNVDRTGLLGLPLSARADIRRGRSNGAIDPKRSWTRNLARTMIVVRVHGLKANGYRGLAAEPWPRKYEAAFRENEIDETVLPNLTAEDLKDLASALSGTAASCSTPSPLCALTRSAKAPPTRELPRQSPKSSQDTAERRQVTVMFSDLVGSTALSARMDPEDLREVISAYQKCVAETVQRFGGFVAKYMGDGVLVYFGYPQAHEDDAERAVRAGLELIAGGGRAEVQRSAANPRGHCHRVGRSRRSDRIGCGSGAAVVGETPNLAARLQGDCRAEHGGHRREHAEAPRQSVRSGGPRRQGPQGHRRAVRAWAVLRASFGGKPLRGAARERIDRACRAGRRTRTAAAALVEGKDRRRPSGAALRRGRHRQVAANGGAAWNASPASRTRACAISARRSTPTARFIRSSARWSAPPDLCTTTPRKRSSTSSTRCWRRPRPPSRMRHCSPRCCRCRTTGVIRRSNWTHNSAGRKRWKRSSRRWRHCRGKTPC